MPGPALSVRLRRGWRLFRQEQPRAVQALAVLSAALLVASLLSLGNEQSPAGPTVSRLGVGGSAAGAGGGASSGHGASGTGSATGSTALSGSAGSSGLPASPGALGAGASGAGGGGTAGAGASTAGGTAAGLPNLGQGVSSSSIKVVFPWPNLGPIQQAIGLYGSSEDPVLSIQAAVDAVNASGGINGRAIDPEIVSFNPLDDASMRALCLQWTQDQHVFAVVDAQAWHDDEQLCITQENHTPLVSTWTTVNDWTARGNPYLWWTGASVNDVLSNLVSWANQSGYLKSGVKFGVVAADREGDTLAAQVLNNDLKVIGLTPTDTGSMHFDINSAAQAQAQARDIVVRFNLEGIHTIIPLLPYTDFLYLVEAAQEQQWYPRWLLSDYEYEDESALGLIDPSSSGPYAKELDGTVNPTFVNLGDPNRDYPAGSLAASCNANFIKYSGAAWQKEQQQNGNTYVPWIESQGTAMTWCENIDLFAAAARTVAPGQLTQANWTRAMAQLTRWPSAEQPDLAFGPSRRAGPHEYRVVEEHVNGDRKCPPDDQGNPQGDCWLILHDWAAAPT